MEGRQMFLSSKQTAQWLLLWCALVMAGSAMAMDSRADSTYILVVHGDAQPEGTQFPMPSGTVVRCTNTRTGDMVEAIVGAVEYGYYEAIFFSTDAYVAAIGDLLEIAVDGAMFIPPNGMRVLTAEDVSLGLARIDIIPTSMTPVSLPGPLVVELKSFPNPFNPRTTVEFELHEEALVNLAVYDTRGHKVRGLIEEQLSSGRHVVNWNGIDNSLLAVPSGVYLLVLKAGQEVTFSKLVLAR